MPTLFRKIVARQGRRDSMPLSLDEWGALFKYGGLAYPMLPATSLGQPEQELPQSFQAVVNQAFKSNGPVFSCMLVRMQLFSEARFQWQRMQRGRPGDLFGNQDLNLLENPWPKATTATLLTRAIQDVDLAGNFYAWRQNATTLRRLRPDYVSIILGSNTVPDDQIGDAVDADVVGYLYQPGGPGVRRNSRLLPAAEVVHWAPIPDPDAKYRGMSWVTPVLREMLGDTAATVHKLKFFEHGATPNIVVSMDASITKEKFDAFVAAMEEDHEGVLNAYRTLYVGGGADVQVVGANLRQLDFKATQGAGETRIAAAAGVPPIIVGLSEGLQSATYSNYGQARRRLGDGTMRPLWRSISAAFEPILPKPGGPTSSIRLWYDDRDIPFLKEDVQDAANVAQVQAATINTLITAGFDPAAVVAAVSAGDLGQLTSAHTGLVSVQLQPPGQQQEPQPQLEPGQMPKQLPPGGQASAALTGLAYRRLLLEEFVPRRQEA